MKKLLALLMALTLVFVLCACDDTVSNESTPADDSTATDDSTPVDESEEPVVDDESEDAPVVDDESEDAPVVDDESEEVSEDEEVSTEPGLELPKDTNKYVAYGVPSTGDRINNTDDKTSYANAVLTGYNVAPSYGSVILYDARFGATIPADADWSEYAILTATYVSAPHFGYVKSDLKDVGAGEAVAIPADGFVLVAHKDQAEDVAAMKSWDDASSIYPHGIQVLEVKYGATYATTAPTIDGVFDASEWGQKVDRVDIDNDIWDYQQFAAEEDYDTAADIYVKYDADYLYYCVVVEMDYHYCPKATSLWDNCSIQVNISEDTPVSEYMSLHYDYIVDPTATTEGRIGQWGYGVTDAGESAAEGYMGNAQGKLGEYKIVRYDDEQKTVYEVKISWTDAGFDAAPSTGDSFGISFSINCREDATTWKNIRMRNGGGIIGRNDWSKMATVTLG